MEWKSYSVGFEVSKEVWEDKPALRQRWWEKLLRRPVRYGKSFKELFMEAHQNSLKYLKLSSQEDSYE